MRFRRYLAEHRGETKRLARVVGKSRTSIWRYAGGLSLPPPEELQGLQQIIEKETGGLVKPEDWPKQHRRRT